MTAHNGYNSDRRVPMVVLPPPMISLRDGGGPHPRELSDDPGVTPFLPGGPWASGHRRLIARRHVEPALLRRNVVVRGISLIALKGRRFRIGTAVFEGTGPCDPCSRMEEALGPGGLNAMRGHGGLTACVIEAGRFRVGDAVEAL